MAFARRPRLTIAEDLARIQSRVEGNGVPYLRLVVSNPRWARAAHGARVMVEHYREGNPGAPVPLGHPLLGWTSVPDEDQPSTVIFAGASRAVDLGVLSQGPSAGFVWGPASLNDDADAAFVFELCISGLKPVDERHRLDWREGGYVVRLLVGDNDGAARRYDVDVTWNDDASQDAEDALDSVQLAVRRV